MKIVARPVPQNGPSIKLQTFLNPLLLWGKPLYHFRGTAAIIFHLSKRV